MAARRRHTRSTGRSAARRSFRVWVLTAGLCLSLLPATAQAGDAVTNGPSYVQVPGSPFAVGDALDALAFSPGTGTLATADYTGGGVEVSSIDRSTGTVSPVAGSPFASGHGPDSVAFNQSGTLLAAANLIDDSVSVFAVAPGGALSPVPGSPFQTGGSPRAVAFSPSGNLLAVANQGDNSVSIYQVAGTGVLTQVPGSPFGAGAEPVALSFDPAGDLLAVANEGDGTVSIFTVDDDGVLTPSAGSPLPVGDAPASVAFSPNGDLLAVANAVSSDISMFTTGVAALAFTPVPGSPFATGEGPQSVAFDATGDLLASADAQDGTIAMFSVSAGGSLTLVQGAPFLVGGAPHSAAFVPNSTLVAAASAAGGTVSVLEPMPAPTATITVPASNGLYVLGAQVSTSFTCSDGTTGPGIAACTDDQGAQAPAGKLDTTTLGRHSYSVTALSADGLSFTTTVTYRVIPAPPVAATMPRINGAIRVGASLRCSHGSWHGGPNRFGYQWLRGGVALAGAHSPILRINRLDEGSQLVCEVTASNGNSAEAASNAVVVPVARIHGCPQASGRIHGRTLGLVSLGQSRAAAAGAMWRSRHDRSQDRELLCLEPAGITVGVPTPRLNRLLGGGSAGRVVWALTANPHYTLDGVGPGIALPAAEKLIAGGTVVRRRGTDVYLVRLRSATLVLLASHGVVTQIGIAAKRVTASRRLRAALVLSLV